MPINEMFWNPYRLIPVKIDIERKPPLTDEKFIGNSGSISCTIKNLTPLFIGGNRNNKSTFFQSNGKYVIPGSSLKGMLRSIAEIAGGGCFVTDKKGKYSKKLKSCEKADNLCIACRMFGMMETGNNAKVHKGPINIGDAVLREVQPETKLFDVYLSSPKIKHKAFYISPNNGLFDGCSRKLYFHQPKNIKTVPEIPPNLKDSKNLVKIKSFLPKHHFDFEIQFSNLRDEELKLLIYTLILEDNINAVGEDDIVLQGPLRHKIGYAKPLGHGTIEININELVLYPPPEQRFETFSAVDNTIYKDEELSQKCCELINTFVCDNSETMQQFRKMMIWDEDDERNFKYPSRNWFNENSQKLLKNI